MSRVNAEIMEGLNAYFQVARDIGAAKDALGLPHYDASRESAMLDELLSTNPGPMPDDLLRRIFNEIFRSSVDVMDRAGQTRMRVSRVAGGPGRTVMVGNVRLGGGAPPEIIAGPCAVEGEDMLEATAARLAGHGVRLLRGGAFKPRTSPYSFQGLGAPGLSMLRRAADAHGMAVVTEVVSDGDVELVARHADMLQVGTRNMYNYALLKALGRAGRPVLLKRSFMATMDEFLWAAEYIATSGNEDIVLCERGIRTFERATRNTLDLAAVALLKQATPLPVVVDLSHSLGRKDIVAPMAAAALAAGADGLMFEAHYRPSVALCDCDQQLDPGETDALIAYVRGLIPFLGAARGAA